MSSEKPSAPETQPQTASRLYDARSETYETSWSSWHKIFSAWVVSDIVRPQRGEKILDLACGTGLVTFTAAEAVGPRGEVIGVDVSEGMLSVARAKLEKRAEIGEKVGGDVKFVVHDIGDLDGCKELKGREGTFDAITCVSALVLLRDPVTALRQWKKYLKPTGRLITDVTHERNSIGGLCIEKVYQRLCLTPPYNRLWVQNERSLDLVLGQAGFVSEESVFKAQNQGDVLRKSDRWVESWEKLVESEPGRGLRESEERREKAKDIFKEEWNGYMGEKGECLEIDGVYVATVRIPEKPLCAGSCACGKLEWTSKALPFAMNFCHCISCRKASGGPFQAFLDFESDDVMIVAAIGAKLSEVELSKNAKRGFCSNCGSSLTIQYNVELQFIGLCAGSLDDSSVAGGMETLMEVKKKHIFVKDKVSWYDLPDDGLERQEHMKSAEWLLVYKD